MSGALSFPIVRIVIILGLSILLKFFIRGRLRDALMPWSVSLLFFHPNYVNFTSGGIHFILMVCYWLNMALVLDGCVLRNCTKNKQMAWWCAFWGYLTLTSLWSEYPIMGVLWYANVLMELFLVGYFWGIWVLRTPNSWVRLRLPVVVVSILSYLIYHKYGFGESLNHIGRASIDATMLDYGETHNVNEVGAALAPYLPLLCVLLVKIKNHGFREWIMKCLTCVAFVLVSIDMIRTGARNSCLVFFPCAWYLFFGGQLHINQAAKRMFFFSILIIISIFCISIVMKDAEHIRAFRFLDDSGGFDLQQISSGRLGEFIDFLSPMSGADWIWGRGPAINKIPGYPAGVGGCLSVYVTLLYNTGVLGMLLLFCVFCSMCSCGLRNGQIGKITLLFFASWALTGIGEGHGIRRNCTLTLLQGASIAFCTRISFQRRDDQQWFSPEEIPRMTY